jgi:chlorobactene glucosyltransferase
MRLFSFSNIVNTISITFSVFGLVSVRKELAKMAKEQEELGKAAELEDIMLTALTVIIPARNEEKHIRKCLEALVSQDYPNLEIIVVNDESTDNTEHLIEEVKAKHGNIRLLNITGKPSEWAGKPYALWQGYQQSNPANEWLLFVDADTYPKPQTVKAAVRYARKEGLDLLSLAPNILVRGFWPRTLAAEINKFYTFAFNNPFYPVKPGSVEEANALGAFLLASRVSYEKVGGHQKVKANIVEDRFLAQEYKKAGFSTRLVMALEHLDTDGFSNLSETWVSVTKNIFIIAHKSWRVTAYVIIVEWLYGLFPLLSLILKLLEMRNRKREGSNGALGGEEKKRQGGWMLSAVASALVFAVYTYMTKAGKIPRRYGLLYPLAAVVNTVMMLHSAWMSSTKGIRWRDRTIEVKEN